MNRKTKFIAGGVGAVALIGGGTAIAVAGGVGDDDTPLTGTTLDKAVAAALEETGGGTVTETEAGDDGAAYSVEVQARGRQPGRGQSRQRTSRSSARTADDDGVNDHDGADDD